MIDSDRAESLSTVLASRISQHVDLADLRTRSIRSEIYRLPHSTPLTMDLNEDIHWAQTGNALIYDLQFSVVVTESEPTGEPAEGSGQGDSEDELRGDSGPLFTADVALTVVYDLDDEGFSEPAEAFRAFGKLSAKHTAYPYLRELVHTLTARAGLPPLVLNSFLAPVVRSAEGS